MPRSGRRPAAESPGGAIDAPAVGGKVGGGMVLGTGADPLVQETFGPALPDRNPRIHV